MSCTVLSCIELYWAVLNCIELYRNVLKCIHLFQDHFCVSIIFMLTYDYSGDPSSMDMLSPLVSVSPSSTIYVSLILYVMFCCSWGPVSVSVTPVYCSSSCKFLIYSSLFCKLYSFSATRVNCSLMLFCLSFTPLM